MKYPEIIFHKEKALELSDFRDMDYFAINNFNISIELMMENAGLHLAGLISKFASKNQSIRIGIGNGNNGGGGLVAARRLAAWGYSIHIDLFTEITKELPLVQLDRALKFGVKKTVLRNPDFWIDAYLGFSQRLPLSESLSKTLEKANNSKAVKISLDIPTGFIGNEHTPYFKAAKILTLAAPKKILFNLKNTELYVADLGIPLQVYEIFETDFLPFNKGSIIKIITKN
jgi:hydroxyethylthiazole kinase-like uncharacterized protein yjeF